MRGKKLHCIALHLCKLEKNAAPSLLANAEERGALHCKKGNGGKKFPFVEPVIDVQEAPSRSLLQHRSSSGEQKLQNLGRCICQQVVFHLQKSHAECSDGQVRWALQPKKHEKLGCIAPPRETKTHLVREAPRWRDYVYCPPAKQGVPRDAKKILKNEISET